jgi:hypothetical protein
VRWASAIANRTLGSVHPWACAAAPCGAQQRRRSVAPESPTMTRRGSISQSSIRFTADTRGQRCKACPRIIANRHFGGLCARCAKHKSRWADPQQPIITLTKLQPYLKQIEGVLRRNPHLDIEGLTERWRLVTQEARAVAHHCETHAHISTERYAACTVRDIGENLEADRALILVAAMHLHQELDAHAYVSDDSFRFAVINMLRKLSHVGRRWHSAPEGGRMKTTKRELNKVTRLRIAKYISSGLGGPAVGLARIEIKRLQEVAKRDERYRDAAAQLSAAT